MPRGFARQCARLAGAFAATVAFARAASAQTEPIVVAYTAPAECPANEVFVADVLRRTARARVSDTKEGVRTFVVTIERRNTAFVGSLSVQNADGQTTARQVTDADCREVASALALATSLAIDPNALLNPEPAPGDEPTTDTKPAKPAPPTPPKPEVRDDTPVAREVAPARAVGIMLGPTLATGIAPRVAFGGSAALGWGTRVPDEAFSSLGLGLVFLGSGPHAVGTASSSFRFIYARPELCTLGLVLSSDFGVGPCLGVEVGAVIGSGQDIGDASTRTRFWLALEPSLRARGYFTAAWFVEASAGLVFPFTRYRFVFRDPDTSVHEVPIVGSVFALSVGVGLE